MTVLDKKYELPTWLRDGVKQSTVHRLTWVYLILRANAAVNTSQIVTSQNDSPTSWAVFFQARSIYDLEPHSKLGQIFNQVNFEEIKKKKMKIATRLLGIEPMVS